MTASLRPYAFTPQADHNRCYFCGQRESEDRIFVPVMTAFSWSARHWIHRECCEAHSAKCAAERDAARAAQRMGAAA